MLLKFDNISYVISYEKTGEDGKVTREEGGSAKPAAKAAKPAAKPAPVVEEKVAATKPAAKPAPAPAKEEEPAKAEKSSKSAKNEPTITLASKAKKSADTKADKK